MRIFLGLALAGALWSKDADFNGRWDIKVLNEPRSRVWWLEVEGAGTPQLKGTFVGAPGGQVDVIPLLQVSNGELVWTFEKAYRRDPGEPVRKGVYRARIVQGKLQGSLAVEGLDAMARRFEGVRAPVIRDVDNGQWKRGPAVELFNGTNLDGWRAMIPSQALGWSVKDGILINSLGANNLVSQQKFWNFELHVEFRLGKESNSGIGLRGRYEVQVFDDFGKPADSHGNGAIYSRMAPRVNASKPAGEWQTFDIRLVGRTVTVVLNGQKVVDRYQIPGLTAIAHDADEALPGSLSLQGDHGIVEFRKISITPLTR